MGAQPQRMNLKWEPSAAYPQWVMLEKFLEIKVEGSSSCSTTDDDATTLAAACTSAGHRIQVSLRLAEPPALSRIFLRIPDVLKEDQPMVLAAHGDSVLIKVRIKAKNQLFYTDEHFVYNAGAAAAAEPPRPPSLLLLPPQQLFDDAIGLLRRGEDELVVAQLRTMGELHLFRSGVWKWICYHCEIPEAWNLHSVCWNAVVPVDYRLLCWVHLDRGVILIDVFEETPRMQYVRLPKDHRAGERLMRNVCAAAGGGALKLVNIFGRCCCGAAASCGCKHSRHAYTIHTWTMRIGNGGDMVWVKDGIVDATEIWALHAYKGLPCNALDRPVVSLDEPDVICFRLRGAKGGGRTRMIWQIMVNMRSKTIYSVTRHDEDLGYCYMRDKLIPSKVSYFFNNTYPSSGRSDDATLNAKSQIDIKRLPSVGDGDASNQMLQPLSSAEPHVQASEIFEALQEIPSYGLGPDEVKAYRVLSNDNGRRLRSLLRLPKNLRKNWLLIEIKASEH